MNQRANQNQLHPSTTRRTFLKGFVGSAVALPVLPAFVPAGSADELLRAAGNLTAADAVSESFWRLVKEQFTIKPKLVLLNAANLCPSPHMVREKVFRLTDDLDSDALVPESRQTLERPRCVSQPTTFPHSSL